MDVDPVAHAKARAGIDALLHSHSSQLKVHTFLKNFKKVKSVLAEVDQNLLHSGVYAIRLGYTSLFLAEIFIWVVNFSLLCNGDIDVISFYDCK